MGILSIWAQTHTVNEERHLWLASLPRIMRTFLSFRSENSQDLM